MFKRILHIIFLIISMNVSVFSQDPTFSQFYANSLYLAPSFAGAIEDNRFSLNYRDQWVLIPGVFKTYSFSFDKYLERYSSGIGILATYDVAGSGNLSTTNIGALYSYDFRINDSWHIRPGVNFKFRYLGLDINRLIFGSQIPVIAPNPYPPVFDNVADIDFTSSVLAYNTKMWFGLTVDHLLRPSQTFYESGSRLPIKYNAFGGFSLFEKTGTIQPKYYTNVSFAFNFQKQSKFYQSDVGMYYNKSILVLGVWYRGIPLISSNSYNDAVIGLIGVKTQQLYIGYSYDFTVSQLRYSTGGTHEISLVYKFNSPNFVSERVKMRALPCPDF